MKLDTALSILQTREETHRGHISAVVIGNSIYTGHSSLRTRYNGTNHVSCHAEIDAILNAQHHKRVLKGLHDCDEI